jgi:hypothetical protein
MPSARSVLAPDRKKTFYRRGAPSKAEKALVAQVVQDFPGEVAGPQVAALATTLKRTKEAVKAMIEQAKENFVSEAESYVKIHKQVVEAALANGDAKSLDVAAKGAQWAIENIGAEGTRIIEAAKTTPQGMKLLIGVNIGGLREPGTIETGKVITVPTKVVEADGE